MMGIKSCLFTPENTLSDLLVVTLPLSPLNEVNGDTKFVNINGGGGCGGGVGYIAQCLPIFLGPLV